jgi:hypothetical protein
MPITEVDKIAVLIVFDQQKDKRALPFEFVLPLPKVVNPRAINRTAKLADAFRHRGTSHSGENAFTNSIEKTGERASTDDVLRLLGTRGAEARV